MTRGLMTTGTDSSHLGVAITGMGVLSPLGHDAATLHQALVEGRSGLRPIEGFDASRLPTTRAGELTEGPEIHLGDRNLRPIDRTGRLAAAASTLALEASGLNPETQDTGLALGTMFGSLRTISEFDRRALTAGPNYTKPFDFANSVINAAAGQAAIWHGLRGVNATVAGGTTAALSALAHGADLIRLGRSPALLAGGAEELCFETCWGLARAGRLFASNGAGPGAVSTPLHARRGGFALGEGGALLVLESEETASRRSAKVLGRLVGTGSSFDPTRGRDPVAGVGAVRRAVEAALAEAGLGPDDLDLLSISASGSQGPDALEASGIAAALGPRAAQLPVIAVKAALGESLGAAGALQTVVALESMRTGVAPGIVGLDEVDPELSLACAGPENRTGTFRRALITAVAWDGPAWALIVAGPETL